MRHYLIDFENTHTRGLKLEQLKPGDHVHIFYSKAASKLDMGALPSGIQVNIDFFEVQTGKQALDMQLASYLGYLVKSANGDRNIGITIVSCDTDYDTVVGFWKKLVPGLQLDRMGVKPGTPKTEKKTAAGRRTAGKAEPAPVKELPADAAAPAEELPEAEEEIPVNEPALPEEPAEVSAPAAQETSFMTVRETYVPVIYSPAEEESLAHVLNELQEEESGTPDAAEKETAEAEPAPETAEKPAELSPEAPAEKPAAKKPAGRKKSAQPKDNAAKAEDKSAQKTDPRTELNNQIIQALSKNKVEANTAGAVAKLILAHQSEKNAKQLIYREIIKSYKQEKGLQIYNLVKTLF